MDKLPVIAHSYAATGEPSHAWVIGWASSPDSAESIARKHYEDTLDGHPPTSWEPNYSWGRMTLSFYNEYKEKYKDWVRPDLRYEGKWMQGDAQTKPYRAPYSVLDDGFKISSEPEVTVVSEEEIDQEHAVWQFQMWNYIAKLLRHKYEGWPTDYATINFFRHDADTICDLMGVDRFHKVYFREEDATLVIEPQGT